MKWSRGISIPIQKMTYVEEAGLNIKEKRFVTTSIVTLADMLQTLATLPMCVKNANQNPMVNQNVIPRNHKVICKEPVK